MFILGFVPALLFIHVGVTLLAVCTDNQISVNHSTKKPYVLVGGSGGRINLYAKVGVYYTYNNSNKIVDG